MKIVGTAMVAYRVPELISREGILLMLLERVFWKRPEVFVGWFEIV